MPSLGGTCRDEVSARCPRGPVGCFLGSVRPRGRWRHPDRKLLKQLQRTAATTTTPPPPPVSYRVPDSACPPEYPYGLTVTTDVEAEVEYLDDMPACTNSAQDSIWLQNDTEAVWELKSKSGSAGVVTPLDETLGQVSFMDAVGTNRPLLTPGAQASVNRPPEDVNWVISLRYTVGWASHDLALDRIESLGEAAAVAALKRRSPAGAALAECALAGVEGAKTVANLGDADASQVMIDVLGTSAAGLGCRQAAKTVPTIDANGNAAVLSDELTHLGNQTELLEKVHVRVDYAQRASKILTLGLKFVHKG